MNQNHPPAEQPFRRLFSHCASRIPLQAQGYFPCYQKRCQTQGCGRLRPPDEPIRHTGIFRIAGQIADPDGIPLGIVGPKQKGRRLERHFPASSLLKEPYPRSPYRDAAISADRPKKLLGDAHHPPFRAQALLRKPVLVQAHAARFPQGIKAQSRHSPCKQPVPSEPRNAEKISPELSGPGRKQQFLLFSPDVLHASFIFSTILPLRNSSCAFSTARRTSLSGNTVSTACTRLPSAISRASLS